MSETTNVSGTRIGPAGVIPPGQGRCFVLGEEDIAVFRQRDGRLFATANRCPHRQGPLSEGLVGGNAVICPLHAHRFDLVTGKGSESGERVGVYRVEEMDGSILVAESASAESDESDRRRSN
jgi:nitrite reductase (NADH) small subunit